jgi:hypothetical protein
MRFMVMIKADRNSEAGMMPSEQLLTEVGQQRGTRVSGRAAGRRRAAPKFEGAPASIFPARTER